MRAMETEKHNSVITRIKKKTKEQKSSKWAPELILLRPEDNE